jgi:hypothetical protein
MHLQVLSQRILSVTTVEKVEVGGFPMYPLLRLRPAFTARKTDAGITNTIIDKEKRNFNILRTVL